MVKKAVQQGRSERKAEAYCFSYVEALSDARTKLADFFSILLCLGAEVNEIDQGPIGQLSRTGL